MDDRSKIILEGKFIVNRELTNLEKQQVIDEKTRQVLNLLGVKKSFRVLNQLASAIKLYKYTFQKINPSFAKTMQDTEFSDKNSRYLHELYMGLTRKSRISNYKCNIV